MATERDNVDVQKLERKISEIEKILDECKPAKLKKGMIFVDSDLIFEKLDELKAMVPEQIKLANNVLSKREKLLKSAETLAHDKIDKANARAFEIEQEAMNKAEETEAMLQNKLSENEIMVEAQRQADRLVEEAQYLSQKSVDEAEAYKDQIINSMNFYMDDTLMEMQKVIEEVMLKNSKIFDDCQARLDNLAVKIEENPRFPFITRVNPLTTHYLSPLGAKRRIVYQNLVHKDTRRFDIIYEYG